MTTVSIAGVRGYVGAELIRLISAHPGAHLTGLYGHHEEGTLPLEEMHPHLPVSAPPVQPEQEILRDGADVVFLALPAGAAQRYAAALLAAGRRVIDLSGGHRLPPDLYPQYYHLNPDSLPDAVYGLSEYVHEELPGAALVANPGCYATAMLLGALPLVAEGLILAEVDAIGYSGISGAGRSPAFGGFSEVDGNLIPYRPFGHQHTPEVELAVHRFAGRRVRVNFLPHVAPIVRGILMTLLVRPLAPVERLREALSDRYGGSTFVSVLSHGLPEVRHVRGTNRAEIAVASPDGGGRAAVYVALDNLGKGAAGQAVQNFNRMFGYPEAAGLSVAGVWP